ncbi:GNAT family N-acetyltransferase [Paenibacillus mendelii]|uniref:GNAT family N-acetyltransferase n=1 Tax=Paenibacillus mendelii TaxID=206163 RepID=A0ABV6J7Y1_9BACL|nr:GNAT family N-acetyltransferase [Paenibacillus mendelii]MCQ6560986.1 GNAT family N-acetyltransferase [Paenibacillus mendelii]
MIIRTYQDSDIQPIVSLFYETVHTVNKRDYTQKQLDAWAPQAEVASKLAAWTESLRRHITYIAEIDDVIVGFSDMTPAGHLDRLYVHKEFQGQGIASALVKRLESDARRLGLTEIDTEASITAKPFFQRHGYQMIQPQTLERRGVQLVNYKMIKHLPPDNRDGEAASG